MMGELNTLTIAEARDQLRAGETTSRALTEACIEAQAGAGALNATCHDTADKALAMADAAESAVAVEGGESNIRVVVSGAIELVVP